MLYTSGHQYAGDAVFFKEFQPRAHLAQAEIFIHGTYAAEVLLPRVSFQPRHGHSHAFLGGLAGDVNGHFAFTGNNA